MAETISVKGVLVTVVKLNGSKWIGEWIGSDGQKCRAIRTSKKALLEAIPGLMTIRSRVFGVDF